MFERVLVANRGEIACRIERTLSRLGIEPIAVYSDADAGAPHVRAAARAVHIGPTPVERSYLDVERIVAAALQTGAEAIHPGYGFLSENPALARACAAAGIAFVGPPPEAIELLGDKAAAKRAAAAAGVPVLPGLGGEPAPSDAEIEAWVAEAELPVMLKAAAGGGGKGMRVVESVEALPGAIEAARREAQAAFGDDRLLVERYVPLSRHIEVQVLADAHGNAIHLGERECSLQRRHQKVVEESPSPVVGPELREQMGAAAVALAKASGYVNAGTVELIAERDDPSRFYFLEVNTRLQVEHPVTEAVTGLDLVELQLRVAAGEPLPISQDEVELRGHAAEARVYAEDPANGFLPSAGRIVVYREPSGARAGGATPGGARFDEAAGGSEARVAAEAEPVRVDSGVEAGTVVGTDYDPMLAKVVAHAPERGEALRRLDRGLGETVLLGPTTNVAYLRALLRRPEVLAGELDTGLLERLGEEIAPPPPAPELPAVALALLLAPAPRDGAGASDARPGVAAPGVPGGDGSAAAGDPWDAGDGWRQAGPAWARARLLGPGGEIDVAIRPGPEAWLSFPPDSGRNDNRTSWEWEVAGDSGEFELAGSTVTVGGESRQVEAFRDGEAVWVLDGAAAPARFALADEERAAAGAAAGGSLEAPMPGVVIDVRTASGAGVEEGEVLVLLESMKMELAVQSPRAGTVAEVLVTKGEQVERGQALVALAEEAA